MSDDARVQAMLDEHEIRKVRQTWAYARDLGEWDNLRSCFHPDATVTISWYSGSAAGFVENSIKMVGSRKPEEHSKHWFGNFRITVDGTRAVSECDAQILARDYLDGVLFDFTGYSRFFDLFEKRDGVWRIAKWICIYDKDRLEPVVPGSLPDGFFSGLDMTTAPRQFAFMRFRQERKGRQVPDGIVLGGGEDERALRAEGERWLSG